MCRTQSSADMELVEYAENFRALNSFISSCSQPAKAALLLSTCRNPYLTLNALFVDIQFLMSGDRSTRAPLRHGSELLLKDGDFSQAKIHFERARQTIKEYNRKKGVWNNRQDIWKEIESAKAMLSDINKVERINNLLGASRGRYFGEQDGWYSQLLALNIEDEGSYLTDKFQELDGVFNILDSATNLGLSATNLGLEVSGSLDPQVTLALDNPKNRRDDSDRTTHILELAKSVARACKWECEDEGNKLSIQPIWDYVHPSNIQKKICLNQAGSSCR